MTAGRTAAPRRRSARWAALAVVAVVVVPAPGSPQRLPALPVADAAAAGGEPITPVPPPPAADPLRRALGERLFQDPRLSGDGARACASCHDMTSNGADAAPRTAPRDGAELPFNTGTVFNAALSFRLGWAGKFRSLEEQAAATLEPGGVMATTVADAVTRLAGDAPTAARFRDGYGHGPDRDSLLDAIATYERSLVTPGSRFDRWLGGDADALSGQELSGYRLFKSMGCVSCHQGVNVGGNLFERQGIFHPLTDPNPGLLRVPALRNVATTAPYFHDGSAPTLEDAVRRMAAAQVNRSLSEPQTTAIVAFLHTLTGNYRGHAVTAPPGRPEP